MRRVNFYKYQSSGNDFVIIEDYIGKYSYIDEDYIEKLCDRNFGVGADGLVLLRPSIISKAKMDFFNADGKKASMCGNATCCVVKHIGQPKISIESDGGIVLGENKDGYVSIKMPIHEEILSPIALDNGMVGHLYHTGVPHLVVSVTKLDIDNFEEEARRLRHSEMFQPEGVNVSYIREEDDKIFIRTYERGVEGETLACGTAGAAVSLLKRKSDQKKKTQYTVYPKSQNPLQFTFDIQENLWMKSKAFKVFEGVIGMDAYLEGRQKKSVKGVQL